ncbi:unnamed protein product [Staurois parvus]|uniref:Uncharacterized protein n=1 Tax=Staurois parvus TaxID=386267 RepID=A0ABN9HP81_9NEOB|nr:unnamed protein product [Staurois parvus]
MHTALDGCAQYSHAKQCDYNEAQIHCPLVKHTQHTVNPLIAPHVNPFLPSAITTVSVRFLALITVVSLGMSVTPSQFRPVSECPPQSCNPAISR